MTIKITTPHYNSLFIASAKRRAGKWISNQWVFDDAEKPAVEKMMEKYYGIKPGGAIDTVTLRVEFIAEKNVWNHAIDIGGRTVAKATGRDSGAKVFDEIIEISGKFTSTGSMKNWYTTARAGTVIMIKNFSRMLAEKLVKESDEKIRYEIVSAEDEAAKVTFDDI